MMVKIKKLTAFILIFCLLAVIPIFTMAAATANIFKVSNNPEGKFQIVSSGSDLIFKDLPLSDDFDYIAVWLIDEYGVETKQLWTARGVNNSVTYNVQGIADGVYYIQLYKSEAQNSEYWSYFHSKSLEIQITDGKAVFVMSPVYEQNLNVYLSKRKDEKARQYYLQPSRDVQSDDDEILTLAKAITAGIGNDYGKIKAIHTWVCNNIWYNYDILYGKENYGDASAMATLRSKRGVCQGYANLTAALLRAVNIPAKVVTGYALGITSAGGWTNEIVNGSEQNHAWNEAYADGHWIILDTTWDSDNKYENKTFSTGTGLSGYRHFDMTVEVLSNDHKLSDYSEWNIPPVIAALAQAAVVVNGGRVHFEAYYIDGNNYFKLRDLAYVLNGTDKQFEISYDSTLNAIFLTSQTPYSVTGGEMINAGAAARMAEATAAKIYVDGTEVMLTAYYIGGNNFFKLRDIMEIFDVYVGYDGASGTITVDTSGVYG